MIGQIACQSSSLLINSPIHTVIPVNCCNITGTTLPVNTEMRHAIAVHFFTSKDSHISFKLLVNSDNITQKWPLKGCVSKCCVCKHEGYTRYEDVELHNFKPNYIMRGKFTICIRMFWLAQSRSWLAQSRSWLAQSRSWLAQSKGPYIPGRISRAIFADI